MKTPITLSVIIICFISIINGQNNTKIDWSPEEKYYGTIEIIGKCKDYIFVLETKPPPQRTTFGKNDGFITILKFDASNKLIDKYRITDLICKKCKFMDLYASGESFHALVLNEENKKSKF